MASPLVVALVAVVLVAVVIPLWTLRGRRRAQAIRRSIDQQHGMPRVSAEVHTGWEQTLIGIARELHLPRDRDREELGYGALYLEPRTDQSQYVRTRSEIGRGFLGLLQVTAHAGPTTVDYSILRLPADERLQARILRLEHDLIAALRRLDPDLTIRTTSEALSEYESPHLPD